MTDHTKKTIGALVGTGLAIAFLSLFVLESGPLPTFSADPTPAGGTAGVYLVDAVADLADLDPNDDDVVILGLNTDGGMLIYDKSSTATVDNVVYFNGPFGGVGRYIRIDDGDGNPTYDMGSQGGAVTLDWTTYNNIAVDLTLDTTFTFNAPTSSRWLTLVITQVTPGGRVITWPATLSGSTPVIDNASGATTVVSMFYDGTSYHVY